MSSIRLALLTIFSSFSLLSCALISPKSASPESDFYWAEMTQSSLKNKSSIVEVIKQKILTSSIK